MADLRTALYTGNGNLSADQLARIDAADMGTLRRSYTGGRITNDINPMLADIASLEADGTPEARTKAAGLRDQVSALEQRRAAYAPEVGKVENINGIGSGLTWAGEQVGQGVASMQDMMLTGAGLTAAGRAVGAIPHPIARAAGMALQGGGVLAPYLMNQRQLAGEAYGDMTEDPALMARTTPQQRYEMARNYGALAAIPDTALPALVGRQLAGAGLRKGLSKIGPAAMTGLELLGEGTTELGQEVGKQYALGQLNPERDTSQDASANLNSFLGGAVGAGPVAAAGAYADAGYRRVGDTAEKIGTKAGQVVDLAGQKLGPMAEEVAKKGRGWIGAGKEKVDASLDSFRGDDGRIDLSKVVAAGKETAGEVRDNAARAVFGITPQERSILEGGTAESIPADIAMDPDPQKAVAWVAQNDRDRVGLVTDRLSSIDDPQAIDIFDRIVAAGDAQDPGAQRLAVDEGAKYLLDRAEEVKVANRAGRVAQAVGSFGAAAGKGAFEFGKAVVDGVKRGLSKKNAQVEPWEQRKADMQAARRSAPAERLAQLWSEALAAAAPQSTIGEKGTALFRNLGERIADLTEVSPPLNQINRIARDIRVGFGKNAEQILDNLASMGDKKSAPTIEAIRAAVVAGRTPAGQRQIAQERQAVSGQLLALLPIEQAKSIIANGQQMDLLEHIEDFADGHAAPALRPALEAAIGKDALAKMVDLVNGVTTSKDRGNEALLEARDDDVTDYELRQAEKKSVKGSGPKIYGVSKSPVLRDNPFAPNERMSKEEFQRWMDDEVQRKSEGLPPQIEPEFERPMLFKTGDPQLDARVAHMDEKLDPTYHIAPRSAWEVMDDTDMPLARRLATYRDYMREDGQNTGMIQKALLDAMDGHDFGEWANPAGGTSAEQQRGSGIKTTTPAAQTKSEARLTKGQRNVLFNEMQAYFSERHLAVAEQIADRAPGQISRTELLSMVRAGKRAFGLHRMKDNPDEHLDQSNLLMFKSEMANQKTDAPGVIYIPVHQLVKWVQAQRERSETVEVKKDDEKDKTYSNRNKNEAYLADVMEGISIILNSGMVEDQLPARVEGLSQDKKPKLAPFTEQNIPKNLRLATMTYGQMMFGLEKKNANITRAEVPAGPPAPVVEGDERRDARADSRYQDKVFKEQNFVEEDDDRKPIDEAPESEHLARKQWHQALTPAEQTELRRRVLTDSDDRLSPEELGFDVRTDEGLADYAEFKKDLLLTGTRGAMFNPDANGRRLSGAKTTDSVETTPLDFFGDTKKPAVPDEFDDQQFRTKNGGESAYSPLPAESKMSAWKEADKNADALLNKFRKYVETNVGGKIVRTPIESDVAGGLAEIEQRLRAAKTPSYSPDKYAAVGGLHYVIPLAQVLNPDVISTMDIVDADAQRIVAARAELAGLVRDAEGFSDAQRVRLTRAMAPAESAARINLGNYRKALEKAINAAPTEEQMTEAPKAAASKTEAPKAATSKDALATAITLRQNYLDNPPADYSADTVRGIIKWAERQAERVAAAAKELDGSEDFKRVDEVNDRAIDLRVLIKSAKESLAQDEAARAADPALFGTDAAPEVAAQSPKSSSAPGGAANWSGKGRKLNAMAADIHRDLNREGFPATHDSPIKHEGRFDWRAHLGRGEGNAAFGAGTYLSTADGVHRSYKRQFTKKLPGARSFEWGGRMFEYDPSDGEIYVDGAPAKTGSGEYEVAHAMLAYGMPPADALAYARDNAYSVVDRSGNDIADHIDLSEPAVPDKDLTYLLAALRKRGQIDPAKVHAALKPFLNAERWNRMVAAADRRADALKGVNVADIHTPLNAASPTYQVSVNIRPEQLLDWDAPLSEQSDLVKKAAARAAGVGKLSKWVTRPDNTWESTDGVHAYYIYKSADGGYFLMQNNKHIVDVKTLSQAQERAHREAMRSVTGQAVYTALAEMLGSQAKASDYLQSLGILGHKYAAVGGKNDTHPNYVIYDDSKITTNYVHFNAQDRAGGPRVASDADIAEAKAYFHKVLGPKVKVLFKEITGYSGEWLDAENTAVISTMAAAGTMQTAYHEALHAFFSKYVKGDPKVLPIMKALAENERILERVKALLHEYPAALAQLADGEERLAYIYQFWAAGLLKLGPGPGRTWLQKLGKFFRGVLGLVSDSERAVDLLEAFHAGKMAEPSAAGRVIAKLTAQPVTVKARRKLDGLSQLVAAATLPAESILLNSPSAAVRALGRKFFSNPGDEEAGKYPEAYLNARKRRSLMYHGVFARAVAGLDSSDLKEVAKYLQQGTDPANIPYKPHADAVRGVREALDRFYTYMKDEKGLSVGYIERYYPVIWSTDILHDKKDEFIKMLTDNYGDILAKGVASSKGNLDEAGVAERIWAALIRNGGGDNKIAPARSDGVLVPYFESGEHRVLNWIKPEHREPFLQKDLIGQISKYFHEGARKAEYQSRFGEHGEKLSELLDPQKKAFDELRWADANKDGPPPGLLDVEYVTKPGQKTLIIATFAGTAEMELMAEADKMVARGELKNAAAAKKWVARQMRDVRQAVGAMEGTLGKDIPEGWRKFNSWMTVYQNVRLLPLALFSSIVDPLGMVARGAELKDAYAAFLAGMKEVVRAWGNEFRDEPKASGLDPKWTRLAEAVGATEAELFAHHVSEEFSSDYMVRGAKTINDKMFILNGMEAWNRAMRIAATKAAVEFIVKHKGLPDKIHSARWLQELGLKPEDIVLNADGELVTDRHELARLKDIPLEQATKEMQRTHWAINRWVEGAILTPNAAQRPSWSSDPRWGIFFHLKQFTYSFHYTLMKRAVKELEYGNLAPIGAFAWYIPVMLASDITRGLIQGGGDLPAYMKGWDVGDHLINATQRAGFLSVGQIGVDAVADPASLGGPAVEQMIDAMRDPLEHSTIKALPLQPIFRNAALS
jgi:hypothetical protein